MKRENSMLTNSLRKYKKIFLYIWPNCFVIYIKLFIRNIIEIKAHLKLM